MARTETLVQLTQPLLALLDQAAAERGVSRSQLIREAVAAYLGAERRQQVDALMVEGYRRFPQTEAELTAGDARRRDAWDDLAW